MGDRGGGQLDSSYDPLPLREVEPRGNLSFVARGGIGPGCLEQRSAPPVLQGWGVVSQVPPRAMLVLD